MSETGKATDFKFGRYITFPGSIRTKTHQNVGEKGAWAYQGTAQFFSIISGTGKATDFKFCTHIG